MPFVKQHKECGEGVGDMGETENLQLCRISGAREGGGGGEGGGREIDRQTVRVTFILICFVCKN